MITCLESIYTYIQDSTSGWVKVSKAEIKELGLQDKITDSSYEKDDFLYLDENSDAQEWERARLEIGEPIELVDETVEESDIRSYNRYTSGAAI